MMRAALSADLRAIMTTHAASFARFVVVGALGFVSDYGMLLYFVRVLQIEPLLARTISLAVAILLTWALNKSWSFKDAGAARRSGTLLPYYGIQLAGAVINFGAFGLVLILVPVGGRHLLVPMAAGSVTALFFNYFFGRRLFKGRGLLAGA